MVLVNWVSPYKRMKLVHYLIPYRKISAKQRKDLNVRAKFLKFLEENIGINLRDFGLGNGFLDMVPKASNKRKK